MRKHKTFYTILVLSPIRGGTTYHARISEVFTNKEEALKYMNQYQSFNEQDPAFRGNYLLELIERELPVYG